MKGVHIGTVVIMMSCFSVEVVSDDEYEAIETSLKIADSLVKSRSIETCHRNLTSASLDHGNRSSFEFSGNRSSLKCDTPNSSVLAHVLPEELIDEKQSDYREAFVEDIDIEDLAARHEYPARVFLDKEPTPLDLWGKPAVFVTTLCMQEWCEMQLDFSLRYLVGAAGLYEVVKPATANSA
jgi:hypothetical protein